MPLLPLPEVQGSFWKLTMVNRERTGERERAIHFTLRTRTVEKSLNVGLTSGLIFGPVVGGPLVNDGRSDRGGRRLVQAEGRGGRCLVQAGRRGSDKVGVQRGGRRDEKGLLAPARKNDCILKLFT